MTLPWPAPHAADSPVKGRLIVPGSKSITNRLLILAALGSEPSTLDGALLARDTRLMIAGLQAMGADITIADTTIEVSPASKLRGDVEIQCGLAGTVMRFLPPVAALTDGPVRFDGDPQAYQRPLAPLVAALRQLGVTVAGDQLPLTVHGAGGVLGRNVCIDASSSSQFISGLLLSAARFPEGLGLRHVGGPLPSLPHIDMTVELLRASGVEVSMDTADPTNCVWDVTPEPIQVGAVQVEPDLSNAGPFLAAAMVTGGEVTIAAWPHTTTQAGDRLVDLFTRMGARVRHADDGDLTLSGPPDGPVGLSADLSEVGELLPTIAAVAALSSGPSHLTGLAHVRGHETDRLAALATELRRLGCTVVELPDGLDITPGRLVGATVECYHDHRMATFGAIVGLRVPGVCLSDVTTTDKTLPGFAEVWSALVGGDL